MSKACETSVTSAERKKKEFDRPVPLRGGLGRQRQSHRRRRQSTRAQSPAPEIKKWLGAVVGKEAEDLTRHDKWLCMMYPRLVLLKQFLAEDGAIFVFIDDNEVASLRMVMDEVFGRKNFVASAVWNMMDSPKNSARYLSEDHEYISIYSRQKNLWSPNAVPRTDEMLGRYKNPDNDH